MSEKKDAGLNEIDMQAVIADYIIANNGCCGDNGKSVSCYGDYGPFAGTACPLLGRDCHNDNATVEQAEAWLDERKQKAVAVETEKRNAEATKKEANGKITLGCPASIMTWFIANDEMMPDEERKKAKERLEEYHQLKAKAEATESAKNEELEANKTCRKCQHIYNADGYIEMGGSGTMICHKKSIRVPIEFTGCRDFEPMATGKVTLQSQHPASDRAEDAVAYAERISQLEKAVKSRDALSKQHICTSNKILVENIALREKCDNVVAKYSDLCDEYNDLAAKYIDCKEKLNLHKEGVLRLEKENSRLTEEIEGYKKRARRALEICGNVELSIDKAANEHEELRKRFNSAQEKISQLEKENAELRSRRTWKDIPFARGSRLLIKDGVVALKITFL